MRSSSPSATKIRFTGSLPCTALIARKRVQLRHLRALRVGGAAADQHLLVRRLLDQPRLEGRRRPRVGLRDRHRVVHPVDQQRLLGALVALRVDDGIAGRAVFGDADVEDLRLLAAELVEEALHHLGGLGNALAGVRDARLANPLLQVLDVRIDVLVDVREDLLQLGRHLAQVRLDLGVAVPGGCRVSWRPARWSRRAARAGWLQAAAAKSAQRVMTARRMVPPECDGMLHSASPVTGCQPPRQQMTTPQMPWMRAVHACCIIGIAAACSGAPPSLDEIGEGYVRAALSLAQHDPDLVEAWRGSRSADTGTAGAGRRHRG